MQHMHGNGAQMALSLQLMLEGPANSCVVQQRRVAVYLAMGPGGDVHHFWAQVKEGVAPIANNRPHVVVLHAEGEASRVEHLQNGETPVQILCIDEH